MKKKMHDISQNLNKYIYLFFSIEIVNRRREKCKSQITDKRMIGGQEIKKMLTRKSEQ